MLDTGKMARLTKGLPSKSEKMRTLAKAGYSRADIARYLGTNYQFVRNVLVREEARASAKDATTAVRAEQGPNSGRTANPNRIRLGADGQLTLPAEARTALGLKDGDTLVLSLDDGEIRLMTIATAVRKAQAIVRQYVPEGVSLVDELLEDRRREVARERGE